MFYLQSVPVSLLWLRHAPPGRAQSSLAAPMPTVQACQGGAAQASSFGFYSVRKLSGHLKGLSLKPSLRGPWTPRPFSQPLSGSCPDHTHPSASAPSLLAHNDHSLSLLLSRPSWFHVSSRAPEAPDSPVICYMILIESLNSLVSNSSPERNEGCVNLKNLCHTFCPTLSWGLGQALKKKGQGRAGRGRDILLIQDKKTRMT